MELTKFIEELRKAQYQIAIDRRFSGDGSGTQEVEVMLMPNVEPDIIIFDGKIYIGRNDNANDY